WLPGTGRKTRRSANPCKTKNGLRCGKLWSFEQLEDRTLLTFSVLGPTVDVSNLDDPQSETGIAINPLNPRNLVVVSNELGNQGHLATYRSFDAGATWRITYLSEKQDKQLATDHRF